MESGWMTLYWIRIRSEAITWTGSVCALSEDLFPWTTPSATRLISIPQPPLFRDTLSSTSISRAVHQRVERDPAAVVAFRQVSADANI